MIMKIVFLFECVCICHTLTTSFLDYQPIGVIDKEKLNQLYKEEETQHQLHLACREVWDRQYAQHEGIKYTPSIEQWIGSPSYIKYHAERPAKPRVVIKFEHELAQQSSMKRLVRYHTNFTCIEILLLVIWGATQMTKVTRGSIVEG